MPTDTKLCRETLVSCFDLTPSFILAASSTQLIPYGIYSESNNVLILNSYSLNIILSLRKVSSGKDEEGCVGGQLLSQKISLALLHTM